MNLVAVLIAHVFIGYVYTFAASSLGLFMNSAGYSIYGVFAGLWLIFLGLIVRRWFRYRETFRQLFRLSGFWFFLAAMWFLFVPFLLLFITDFRRWVGLTNQPR